MADGRCKPSVDSPGLVLADAIGGEGRVNGHGAVAPGAVGDFNAGGGIAAGRWIRISATGHPRAFAERADVQGADNPLGGC